MYFFAEAVCANCENGMTFPLEIAFADPSGTNVYVFKIQSPPVHCRFTLRDALDTRSRLRNRDRFYNVGEIVSPSSSSPPPRLFETTLDWDSWIVGLRDWWSRFQGGPPRRLYVRGRYQARFFRDACGFPDVARMKMDAGPRVSGAAAVVVGGGGRRRHTHLRNRTVGAYPCPAIEVATMALYCRRGRA